MDLVTEANRQIGEALGDGIGLEFRDGVGGRTKLFDVGGEPFLLALISTQTLAVLVEGREVHGAVLAICNARNRVSRMPT